MKITYNPNTIQIIWFRHGSTPFTEENRAQGSSNNPVDNGLNEKGIQEVCQSAKLLKEELSGINPEQIYIYSPQLYRTIDTAFLIAQEIGLLDGHLCVTNALNNKNYGEIEGMKDVKKPKTIIKNPSLGLSYVLSELGVRDNGAGIETKQDFEARIFKYLDSMLISHNPGDVIIISCSSEHFNRFRKSKTCKEFFNFESTSALDTGCFTTTQLKPDCMEIIGEISTDHEKINSRSFY